MNGRASSVMGMSRCGCRVLPEPRFEEDHGRIGRIQDFYEVQLAFV